MAAGFARLRSIAPRLCPSPVTRFELSDTDRGHSLARMEREAQAAVLVPRLTLSGLAKAHQLKLVLYTALAKSPL